MISILGIILLMASAITGDEQDFNLFDRHCVGKPNGFKYQSPHDCSEFYTCMNEGAWMDMCPDGLYFDEKLQDCEEPKNVVCHQIQSLPACTSQTAGAVTEHDDCTKFYICNGKIWITGQCEDGLSFVKQHGTCQWLQNEQCPEAIFRRKLVLSELNVQPFEKTHMDSRCAQRETQETQHLAHPTSCSKFFKCYMGEAFLEHCPAGLHFSVELDRCEDIEVAKCQIDRWNHNLMQENEKKQKHKGKPQYVASQFAVGAESDLNLPLMAVSLPSSVKQSVGKPKEVMVANTYKPSYESQTELEEYLNQFSTFLNSLPVDVNHVKEEKTVDEVPVYTQEKKPLEPFMVIPSVPGNTVQNYQPPNFKPIKVVSVEPIPLQTMPIHSVNPVQPISPMQPAGPIEPISPMSPVSPMQPGNPMQSVNPMQPISPMQPAGPEQTVEPIQHLPVYPAQPDHAVEKPKKQKKPTKPKYENFTNEQEYFNKLFEYYYPAHSNPVGYNGQLPEEQWMPVKWLAPKRKPQRQQFHRNQYNNVHRPTYGQRYRDAETPVIQNEGTPDGRCPWVADPANPIHLAHPTDCSKFYKCHVGSVYEHNCPEGLEWSVALNRCEHPAIAKCSAEQPIIAIEPAQAELANEYDVGIPDPRCPRVEGKYVVHFEHPMECNKFYKCSFGLAYLINCPPGLHWARELNRCDFKHVALCPYRYQL